MFNLPKLTEYKRESIGFSSFSGYDVRKNAPEDSLTFTKNIAVEGFPALKTRSPRKTLFTMPRDEKITGIFYIDRAYVTTEKNGRTLLYYGDDFKNLIHGYTSNEDELVTSLFTVFDGKLCLFNLKTELGAPSLIAAHISTLSNPTRIIAPDLADVCVCMGRAMGCVKNQLRFCKKGSIIDWDHNDETADPKEKAFYKRFSLNTNFTACTNFKNKAYFFTEDEMYELVGKNSQDFDLVKIANVGCTNRESLCEADGKLYFNSLEGVMCYNGSAPKIISREICDFPVKNINGFKASLVSSFSKLYTSFEGAGGHNTYCCDLANRKWSREDESVIISSAHYGGKCYIATQNAIYETDSESDEEIFWEAVGSEIYCYSDRKKQKTKLELCVDSRDFARLEVYISLDGAGYKTLSVSEFSGIKTLCIPIECENFSKFRIKLKGRGRITLGEMTLSYSLGGALNE